MTRVLPDDTAKSRFSVAYLRLIAAQAGLTFDETSPDEDFLGVDAWLHGRRVSIPIQVKCTSSPRTTTGGFRLPVQARWFDRWKERAGTPVHLVYLVVPKVHTGWVRHLDDLTELDATAYWQRFDPAEHLKSIVFPTENRLTSETLAEWQSDSDAGFGEV